ncbi:MAG: hypothetical protein VX264_00535 [Chloroflexota bacterium]|nr:hypothetical protein [Chloroflexota bacterium]MEE3248210.1 hypothetical protein [Chloroflexota bacterium]
MPHWVETQSAKTAGGVVTKTISNQGMTEFVDRDRGDECEDYKYGQAEKPGRIVCQKSIRAQ